MNTNGYERPNSARIGKYDYSVQSTFGAMSDGFEFKTTVDESDFPAAGKYLDLWDDTVTVVCSGAVLSYVTGIAVLTEDTADGQPGRFTRRGRAWLPIVATITPAQGDILYWDVSAYNLTDDDDTGANFAAGTVVDGTIRTIATATLGSLPVGRWIEIQFAPVAQNV